jgi:S-(hydroxymethyl)glutathione dehydrogenase/alcohol dehydrogenase
MGVRTQAAISYAPNELMVIEEVALDPPGEGEVLVEIKAAGLCHTDLDILGGQSPFFSSFPLVPGHEGAGVVVEVGPNVTDLKPGDHVLSFSAECGVCGGCKSTKGNICDAAMAYPPTPTIGGPNGRIWAAQGQGTFANHMVTRAVTLANVRKDAPFDEMSYLSCGAATGIGAVIHTAKVEPGSSVIVFGLGGIGLNVIQGARMAGATTIVGVDVNPMKGEAAIRLGATHFVNPKTIHGDLVGHLNELTCGGADYTFEAVGNINLMEQALAAARIGWGVCTVIGVAPIQDMMSVSPLGLLMGRKLQGCAMGGLRGRSQLPELVDWLMEGRFDLASLISHRLTLGEINEGFDLMKRGESLRSVVIF